MGHSRPRFNKQRQEQLDARRKGKRKAEDDSGVAGNAEILLAKTADERAHERELKLLQEQNALSGKMSSKKKRRLDKYIDKKLKKDKRGELFKSLAASQDTVASPLLLQPSSTLGSKQFRTNQDKLDRTSTLHDRKRQRVHDAVADRKRGYHSDDSDEQSDGEDDDAGMRLEEENNSTPIAGPSKLPRQISKDDTETAVQGTLSVNSAGASANTSSAIGSGLKGGIVPVVVKRNKKLVERRRFGKQIAPHLRTLGIGGEEEDASDDSFDSSDSAYDTDSSEEESEGQDVEEDFDDEEEWGGIGEGADSAPENQEKEAALHDNVDLSKGESVEPEGSEDADSRPSKRRTGTFKRWANQQLGIAVREDEGEKLKPMSQAPRPIKQEGPLRGPLGEEMAMPAGSLLDGKTDEDDDKNPKVKPVIVVDRSEKLQAARLRLPILAEEDAIMEAIRQHSVVVLCGETGSGKTTQVPQFLYEAGFGSLGLDNPGMIGITQPRRVAAMAMASRVAEELSLPPSRVSYQIRYDATTSPTTSIKFMTDGVLLRELASDFLLNKYSVVIVDEAHERSVNTDVLIGTLSRVVRLRESMWREGKQGVKPLRLIIMSATLRVTDFTENKQLFKTPPPLINVAARQYPVVTHFNRKTKPDYLTEAYKKVSKIHARLPPGGVLVFLTGQSEITTLCKRLEKRFGGKAINERVQKRKKAVTGASKWRMKDEEKDTDDVEAEQKESITASSSRNTDVEAEEIDLGYEPKDLATDVDEGIQLEEVDEDALDSDYDEDDPDGLFADREEDSDTPMHILPLYSLLPTNKQMRVFQDPPEGARLVVVATNVAETSLTIPNIKYVVDCGRSKERSYDNASGIQSFDISWISKASASQRAGRAGRTGPGHCYRLYSSAVYERQFTQFASPEILRMPIEGIVLQMKSMNIDQVVNFPFPTPPDRAALQKAERVLVNLGALTAPSTATGKQLVQARITDLGNAMSLFPLSPRFSKMLVVGQQHGCLPYVIALVSALSVGDPFLRAESLGFNEKETEGQEGVGELLAQGEGAEIEHITSEDVKAKETRKLQRRAYYQVQQRHASLGKSMSDILKILSVVGAYEYDGGSVKFCETNFVRIKAMQEIHKLRSQISRIVSANYPELQAALFTAKLLPPSETQLKVLRQLLTAAFIDQVALRKDLVLPSEFSNADRYPSTRGVPYRAVGVDEDVFIHPSSVIFHNAPPECVVYQELTRTSKVYLREVTKINTAWLPTLGKPLCTFSRVLETAAPAASKLVNGSSTAEERDCFVSPKFAEFDNLQLAPVKAKQRRVGSRWVIV